MDSAEILSLFAQTLLGSYESDESWSAVNALRQSGSREIFDKAAVWCRSGDGLRRARGAAVLCQLRRAQSPDILLSSPEWLYRDESFGIIEEMLEHETDPMVLDSAVSALGHLGNPSAIPIILRYQNHPDKDVRFAVAFALGCFPNDSQSITGLLGLAFDSCSEVRDWAVFGVGVLGDADSPEIREALIRCLNDRDRNVREEAAVGLGKRHDERLLPTLRVMLDDPEFGDRVEEAAATLLGFSEVPSDWISANYQAALTAKFGLPE